MVKMQIGSTITPKVVEDFDILLLNGVLLPLTVDKDAGDTVEFVKEPLAVVIYQAPRPSTTDPTITTPAEETTIYVQHIASITRRTREVYPLAPEQQDAFKKLLQRATHPTIQ